MEEVIKRIIEIEQEAAQLEKQTAEKIRLHRLEQEKNLVKLSQTIKEKATAKVKTLREREMAEVEEEIRRKDDEAQKQIENLINIKKQKAEQWICQLYQEITKE